MKNLFLITSIISVFCFSSCKKNYMCKCFKSADDQKDGIQRDTMKHVTRKYAETHCAGVNQQIVDHGKTYDGVCYAAQYYQ